MRSTVQSSRFLLILAGISGTIDPVWTQLVTGRFLSVFERRMLARISPTLIAPSTSRSPSRRSFMMGQAIWSYTVPIVLAEALAVGTLVGRAAGRILVDRLGDVDPVAKYVHNGVFVVGSALLGW